MRERERDVSVYVAVNILNGDMATGCWFDLWTGAVAISAMCVASGRGGTSLL